MIPLAPAVAGQRASPRPPSQTGWRAVARSVSLGTRWADGKLGALQKLALWSQWACRPSPFGHQRRAGGAGNRGDIELLATVGDAFIRLWDAATGDELAALQPTTVRVELGTLVSSSASNLAFSPDGKTLAGAGQDLELWEVRTLPRPTVLEAKLHRSFALAFSADGKVLVSGGEALAGPRPRGEVRLWDPATGKELAALRGYPGAVRCLAVSPDGKIIAGAAQYKAAEAFNAEYRLRELRREAEAEWARMDTLVLPTTGTIYTHEAIAADPVALNTKLGYYTNFVNLLDLAAVAVPAGLRSTGLPFGISFIGPAFTDEALLVLADAFQRSQGEVPGPGVELEVSPPGCVLLAVVGSGGWRVLHVLVLLAIPATLAPLWQPHGVCVGGKDTLIISDTKNHRVRLLVPIRGKAR